jgi:hypothetical protein
MEADRWRLGTGNGWKLIDGTGNGWKLGMYRTDKPGMYRTGKLGIDISAPL